MTVNLFVTSYYYRPIQPVASVSHGFPDVLSLASIHVFFSVFPFTLQA